MNLHIANMSNTLPRQGQMEVSSQSYKFRFCDVRCVNKSSPARFVFQLLCDVVHMISKGGIIFKDLFGKWLGITSTYWLIQPVQLNIHQRRQHCAHISICKWDWLSQIWHSFKISSLSTVSGQCPSNTLIYTNEDSILPLFCLVLLLLPMVEHG